MKHLIIILGIIGLAVSVVGVEIVLAFRNRGEPFKFSASRTKTIGSGPELTYVVMGDSTAVGQGGDYDLGIIEATAQHLAKNYTVNVFNFAESGAQTADVLRDQLPLAIEKKPDIILLVVGANDVTHVTPHRALKKDLNTIVDQLVASNCKVKIVLTGAPQMGVSPRFGPLISTMANFQTNRVNKVFKQIITDRNLTFAPIADKAGPIFVAAPEKYFANDEYHPNNAGYGVWIPIINESIDQALKTQPNHCSAFQEG